MRKIFFIISAFIFFSMDLFFNVLWAQIPSIPSPALPGLSGLPFGSGGGTSTVFGQVTSPSGTNQNSTPTTGGANPSGSHQNQGIGVPATVGTNRQSSTTGAAPGLVNTGSQSGGTASGGITLSNYDPLRDNLLKAPAIPSGLFGLHVKDVEQMLRKYGAKPYSYAFGKHSRMAFSVYLITLMFDKERRLGAVVVDPRAPFTKIEPQAQKFIIDLFLKTADLNKFTTIISKSKLEIKYRENDSKAIEAGF